VSESRKTLISVLLVAVVLAGVATWLVLGVRQSRTLGVSIVEKGAKLRDLHEKIAAVPLLRQEQQKLAGELEEYETILPNDRELNKIFDTLSEYEKRAGLKIQTFNPTRDRKTTSNALETSYRQVSYELDLAGDYFSLAKFLSLLENHDRFVQVDSFTIKQKGQEGGPVNDIGLKLSTFVYDPKAKPARKSGVEAPVKSVKVVKGPQGAKEKKAPPEVPFDLKRELANRYVYRDDARRRDPFTNPLTRRINVAKFETPDRKRLMSPDQEKTACETIDKQLMEVARLICDAQLDAAEKLLADTRALMDSDFRDPSCATRQLGFSRQVQRLRIMLRTSRGEQLYKIVQESYDKMLKAFERGDYDEVYRLYDGVKEMVGKDTKDAKGAREKSLKSGPGKLAKAAASHSDAKPAKDAKESKETKETKESKDLRDIDDLGEPIHDRLDEVIKACDVLCERAGARREFASVAIQIQGTFWSGKGEDRRAAAIINGQTLVEGERLSLNVVQSKGSSRKGVAGVDAGAAEIIVQKIDREKVTFLYKNELIDKFQFAQE
jgi:Tfp pilus assembly protein PilO